MHWLVKAVLVLIVVLSVATLWGSDYQRQAVTIELPQYQLAGSLVLPKNNSKSKLPVLIFVHGDGALSSNSYGYYEPLWQALAAAGIASLSWDKAGVGGSGGHWLQQNMQDRATLLSAAIDWAEQHPRLDSQRIGVIGFSQAGWVVPKVLAQDPRLRYGILVSTAVSWQQQGQYQTTQRLQKLGQQGEELSSNLAYNQQLDALLNQQVPYQQYQSFVAKRKPPSYGGGKMNQPRYQFVVNNMAADASADLPKVQQAVLALFGDSDKVVDVQNSISVYQQQLAGPLQFKVYQNADHGLFNNDDFAGLDRDSLWFGIKMNWLGQQGLAEGFTDDVVKWVLTHTQLTAEEQ